MQKSAQKETPTLKYIVWSEFVTRTKTVRQSPSDKKIRIKENTAFGD